MSEHHDAPDSHKPHNSHQPHALHEEHSKGPSDPDHINPKISSDMAHWAREFNVTTQVLHEAIRSHGTKVEKVRAALHPH